MSWTDGSEGADGSSQLVEGEAVPVHDLPNTSTMVLGRSADADISIAAGGIINVQVIETLFAQRGNQTSAARALGISRGTLLARIEALDIPRPQNRK